LSTQSIALIGTGMVAMAHVQSIADLSSKISLRGVLARHEDSALRFSKTASDVCGYAVRPYKNLAELLADDVDWVVVLTPPNARSDIVSATASAGKSILTEKPLERTFTAAKNIVHCCETAGVLLGVVFQHRMRKVSQKLASLMQSDSLGELVMVEAKVPWWREQSYYDEPGRGSYERDGGGVLISQAIHTLDLMLSVTGPVSDVMAMASTTSLHNMESEDYVSASLKFRNGAVGSLVASTASYPGDAESLTLHCANCVAHLQAGELLLRWHDGREERFGASANTGGGADPMAFTHTWHRSIIEDFSDAFRRGSAPCVTGREALAVHALIDALIKSSAQQQMVSLSNTEQ